MLHFKEVLSYKLSELLSDRINDSTKMFKLLTPQVEEEEKEEELKKKLFFLDIPRHV